jgi:hypothetical protein
MNKIYNVEIKLGSRWTLIQTETRQTDALDYVRQNAGKKYPMRIVRVVRTIVFDGTKS